MEGPQGRRKLPRGERCGECGSNRWYVMDGRRYCSNGHESEGFVQFDVGDLDDSGPMGAVAKREKEVREREKRHLTGPAGKLLYLEALQLVLRSQILWLVNDKGHRDELETVVRDLWDLRIRGASALVVPEEAAAEGEVAMFSSQPSEEGDEQGGTVLKSRARAQSWDPERGLAWPLPRMLDTLALCYLGCLLLRIPTRIGELVRWASNGNMPYRRAYYDLPQEMQDRMPSAYTRALKLPARSPLVGDELYDAVLEMALSYFLNYTMAFPPVNDVSAFVQYARILVLPVESIMVAKRLLATLQLPLQFAVHKSRMFPLDHPEIVPVAVIVVATKLCFPFSEDPLSSSRRQSGNLPGLVWQQWEKAIAAPIKETQQVKRKSDYRELKPEEVVSMTDEDLDAYFARVSSLIDKPNDGAITQFFPSEAPPPPDQPTREPSDREIDESLRVLMGQVMKTPSPDSSGDGADTSRRQNHGYEAFRTAEDLSGIANAFYSAAADAAGISLETLVRAVYMLEQHIVVWQKREDSRERARAGYTDDTD